MFICKKCGKVDNFNLMFNPEYKGEKNIQKSIDKNGNIHITTDNYTFIPDINFMNKHAVCSYCGSIYCWGISDR